MKNNSLLLVFCLFFSIATFAQQEPMTREEKDEKNAARMERINSKNDYALFRKQILGLKEYDAERQKIPALRKSSKMPVKVSAVIDSNDNDVEGESKNLIGYIRQDVGDNSTNMYELTYNRAQKKIISIKHTQEAIDADKEEMDEDDQKSPGAKKTIHKKSKDDDDDPDDDKPTKGKQKDKDED